MTKSVVGVAIIAALLLMFAPLATASEGNETKTEADANETRPDDAAWVEDCPPDMMCAFSANESGNGSEPQQYGPEDCIACSGPVADGNATRGPEDCETCRNHSDADCPDCITSHMPVENGTDPNHPVDNTTWGTDCPPDMLCMYDGAPTDDGREPATNDDRESDVTIDDDASEGSNDAPGLGVLALVGGLGVTAMVLAVGLGRRDT